MSRQNFRRKLTALLSADVEGYSRLMGEDEAATVETITVYREVMTTLIQEYRGRVVDSPGDNLLAEFASVVDAVQCAVEIQEKLKLRNAELPENRKMEFRIGINLGDVIQEAERLYGDGVNIAARIESLAEAGGICISGSAYEQIENKLALGCEYLGEHAVKNITKPVHVYRVWKDPEAEACRVALRKSSRPKRLRTALAAAAAILVLVVSVAVIWKYYQAAVSPEEETTTAEKMATAIPEKPSIAVLPFANLSGNSDQEYFSDGMTNDIITDLSKFRELIVTASNTVFTYKGKSVDIKEVGRNLGVRYILEGSVQKAGNRVRVNAQLIDATSGHHIWAERYDRKLEDVFGLQDEIIQTTVRKLALKIDEAERSRVMGKGTANLEAYDYALRGWHQYHQRKRLANRKARQLFKKAAELDPGYVSAYVGLAWSRTADVVWGWTEFPNKSFQQALELAIKAVNIDGSNASARAVLGYIYMRTGEYDLAIGELQTAIDLNPNDWRTYRNLGAVMLYAGRPDEALRWYELAMTYDPYVSPGVFMNMGMAHYLEGRYDEAIRLLKEGTVRWPNFLGNHILLAATYAQTDRGEKAKQEAAEVLRISPFFETEFYGVAFRNPEHRAKIIEGLHKAGLT